MKISEKLAQAWSDVEDSRVPEHVQAVALVEALRMRFGGAALPQEKPDPKKKVDQTPAKAKKSASSASDGDGATSVDDDAFFAAIERETGVSADTLETIIFLKDGVPCINAPRRMLGQSLKQSQVNVAALITVARHFGLGEAEVPDLAVRTECQRLNVFDRNFAANVKGLAGILQTGDRTKVFKIRAAAIDTFAASVVAVSGEDGQS